MQKQRSNQNCVRIKLEKWQIPYLLGAARLGLSAEDWCAALIQTSMGTYDTHSAKWILAVAHIIDSIKKQTGIVEEDKEYGYTCTLGQIERMINSECDKNEESFNSYQKQYFEQLESNEDGVTKISEEVDKEKI
ncbi:MAG: hypothetical protein ACD_57C00224G0003 [uncultured bacterium]|nr:MAG: hypothetical protein ACD_57C00224G0003 [uncultured bacterium]